MTDVGHRVKIEEIVQAGDTFLIRFSCPYCFCKNFSKFPQKNCSGCGDNLEKIGFLIPENRSFHRLLVGTRRKQLFFRKKIVRLLLEMQNNFCAYCDKEMSEFHIEHIIPLAVGGSNNFSNLCLSCPKCNFRAGSLVFKDFWAKKLYVMGKV